MAIADGTYGVELFGSWRYDNTASSNKLWNLGEYPKEVTSDTYTFSASELLNKNVECTCIEDHNLITVQEFKTFIVELVRAKGGKLPDIEDWKEIKQMMDRLYDPENCECAKQKEAETYWVDMTHITQTPTITPTLTGIKPDVTAGGSISDITTATVTITSGTPDLS